MAGIDEWLDQRIPRPEEESEGWLEEEEDDEYFDEENEGERKLVGINEWLDQRIER